MENRSATNPGKGWSVGLAWPVPIDWPGGVRHGGDVNLFCGVRREREKARAAAGGRAPHFRSLVVPAGAGWLGPGRTGSLVAVA
jgi:hypothetical protein